MSKRYLSVSCAFGLEEQGRREGGACRERGTCPGPQPTWAPKIGASLRHWGPRLEVSSTLAVLSTCFKVLSFENNDVIGAPDILLPRVPRILSATLCKNLAMKSCHGFFWLPFLISGAGWSRTYSEELSILHTWPEQIDDKDEIDNDCRLTVKVCQFIEEIQTFYCGVSGVARVMKLGGAERAQ